MPLETVESLGTPGNNQNLRYRIPRGTYELPDDLTFSAEETALLGLAAMVWREGSLSDESRRAILKLKSFGDASDEPVLGYEPRLRIRDAAFEPLRTALERNTVVRFAYLKPGESDATARTVEPLALVQHQGRWHLHARETTSGQTRTFLLRRIVSQIATTGPCSPPPLDDVATGGARRTRRGLGRAHRDSRDGARLRRRHPVAQTPRDGGRGRPPDAALLRPQHHRRRAHRLRPGGARRLAARAAHRRA